MIKVENCGDQSDNSAYETFTKMAKMFTTGWPGQYTDIQCITLNFSAGEGKVRSSRKEQKGYFSSACIWENKAQGKPTEVLCL